MTKPAHSRCNPILLVKLCTVLTATLWYLAASAQTPSADTDLQSPSTKVLNLDADDVVKEMSKESHTADVKPAVLSTAHSDFEQSILNSTTHKKISGMVEAGAGVGNMPVQHGLRSESVNCEYTAVAVNDQISSTAQLGVYAAVDTCHAK